MKVHVYTHIFLYLHVIVDGPYCLPTDFILLFLLLFAGAVAWNWLVLPSGNPRMDPAVANEAQRSGWQVAIDRESPR